MKLGIDVLKTKKTKKSIYTEDLVHHVERCDS